MSIVGDGAMGQAYATRLGEAGCRVTLLALQDAASIDNDGVVLLALFDGAESCTALEQVPGRGTIVDLTTQAVGDCQRNVDAAGRRGMRYFAGGVTGGAEQARAGAVSLCIGPRLDGETMQLLALLGTVHSLETAASAVCAKLLHNFVLLVQTQALAAAVLLAEAVGINDIGAILDGGTAGRQPSRSSVIRDARGGPRSSYTVRLARKDIDAILASFPGAAAIPGLDLAAILPAWSDAVPDSPFTLASLGSVRQKLENVDESIDS